MTNKSTQFMQKASKYGLQEYLEIMSELSQVSTKKGLLSRLQKELITYGLALYKNCQRCISIHESDANNLKATDFEFNQVKKIILFMNASPHGDSVLWDSWELNWLDFSHSKIKERQQLREMVALAISIVMQHQGQIYLHLTSALDVGITIEEIFEIVPIAMLMDGAPTLSQIPTLLTYYDEYEKNKQIV